LPARREIFSAASWLLAAARELDDALLHLRFNEPETATLVLKTSGNIDAVLEHDRFLHENRDHWAIRETALLWRRVLKLFRTNIGS